MTSRKLLNDDAAAAAADKLCFQGVIGSGNISILLTHEAVLVPVI